MNFYEKRNKKSNLTKNEIAAKLNIDKEKIEELENRNLEINGNAFENYIGVTNMTKAEYDLEYAKLLDWYQKTDLRSLRAKFGYQNQYEFAKVVNSPQSAISNMETKHTKKPSYTSLIKLYNFYNNDFNKKSTYANEVMLNNTKPKKNFNVFEGYKDIDWEKVLEVSGLKSNAQLAEKLGIKTATISRIKSKDNYNLSRRMVKLVYKALEDNDLLFYKDEEEMKEENMMNEKTKVMIDEQSKVEYENNIVDEENNINNINDCECEDCKMEDIIKMFHEMAKKIERYEKIIDRLLRD